MEKQEETSSKEGMWTASRRGTGMKILAFFGAVFLVLLVVGLFGRLLFGTTAEFGSPMRAQVMMNGETGIISHGGGMYGMDRGLSNHQSLSGVVTSVNGTSFVLAGDGLTNTITTDTNTSFLNNIKPVVNDTVTVVGGTNNGVFTASQVIVQN